MSFLSSVFGVFKQPSNTSNLKSKTCEKKLPKPTSTYTASNPLPATTVKKETSLSHHMSRKLSPRLDVKLLIKEQFEQFKQAPIVSAESLHKLKESCLGKIDQLKNNDDKAALFQLVKTLEEELIITLFSNLLTTSVDLATEHNAAYLKLVNVGFELEELKGQPGAHIQKFFDALDLSFATKTFPHHLEQEVNSLKTRLASLICLKPDHKECIKNIQAQIDILDNLVLDKKLIQECQRQLGSTCEEIADKPEHFLAELQGKPNQEKLRENLTKLVRQKEAKYYGEQNELHPTHPCALAQRLYSLKNSSIQASELDAINYNLKELPLANFSTIDQHQNLQKLEKLEQQIQEFEQKLEQHLSVIKDLNKEYLSTFPLTQDKEKSLTDLKIQLMKAKVVFTQKKQMLAFMQSFLNEDTAFNSLAVTAVVNSTNVDFKDLALAQVICLLKTKLQSFTLSDDLERFQRYLDKLKAFLKHIDTASLGLQSLQEFVDIYTTTLQELPALTALQQSTPEKMFASLQNIAAAEKAFAKAVKDFPMPVLSLPHPIIADFAEGIKFQAPIYEKCNAVARTKDGWRLKDKLKKLPFDATKYASSIYGLSLHKAVFAAEKQAFGAGLHKVVDQIAAKGVSMGQKISTQSQWLVNDLFNWGADVLDSLISEQQVENRA